jgi:hypothetical protein
MTEERRYAILFAATLLYCEETEPTGFGQAESSESGCGRERDQSCEVPFWSALTVSGRRNSKTIALFRYSLT